VMHSFIETFPVKRSHEALLVEDFLRFGRSFSEIVCARFPEGGETRFWWDDDSLAQISGTFANEKTWQEHCRILENGDAQYARGVDYLVFSIDCLNDLRLFVCIEKLDDLFIKRMADDWFVETISAIRQEFLLFKQARVDSQTGLLNLVNFEYLLESVQSENNLKIVLVEMPPVRVSSAQIYHYLQRAVSALVTYFQSSSALHYLGGYVFGLVAQDNMETKGDFEASLVSYLKRAGFRKVYMGSVGSREIEGYLGAKENRDFPGLIDMGWTALRYATRSGPYGYCDYRSLVAPQEHELAAPGSAALTRLRNLAGRQKKFSLGILKGRGDASVSLEKLQEWAAENGLDLVSDTDFVYLFAADSNAEELSRKIRASSVATEGAGFVACGIAVYPFLDYSRTNVIANCKKAYRHALLLGDGEIAVFDNLSLNVSGDIYFAAGELLMAVKEYRQGIQLAADDVNLNNSLGVTLALMDKVPQAETCFRNVLTVEPENFMALYNLGLAELGKGNNETALPLLLKAAGNIGAADDPDLLVDDLHLQIGRLAAELGEYSVALQYLTGMSGRRAEFAHYPLGVAYYGVGEKKKAMIELQRALQADQFDAKAMGLLGRIYFEENQGVDIAFALCRKSMQLDPDNDENNIFYSEICAESGRVKEGRATVRKCLRRKKSQTRAQLAMARICRSEKNYKNALAWLDKVLTKTGKRSSAPELRQLARAEKKELLREMSSQ